MRMPGQIGPLLGSMLRRRNLPFGLEVVGDPKTLFAMGSIRHPLRGWVQAWACRELRNNCRCAAAVSYVTQDYLQSSYPAGLRAFTTHYSSIQLPQSAFVSYPRVHDTGSNDPFRVACVGTMSQPYKGHDVLLRAIAICRQRGLRIQLQLVGDGCLRGQLEQLAESLGLLQGDWPAVQFRGQLSAGEAIRSILDSVSLFILPSRSEGLPRALIEAMARALPCIATRVGGVPELLANEVMVAPDDVDGLAQAILDLYLDPQRMNLHSERNLHRAREFRAERLQARRVALYGYLRSLQESHPALPLEAA